MKFLIRNKYFLATIPWCTHMAGEGFQLGLNAKNEHLGYHGSWQLSLSTQPLLKNKYNLSNKWEQLTV